MFRQLIALVVITLTAATTYAQQQTHNFFSIEKALKSPEHVFYLDLSNQQLTTLPSEMSTLKNLISLNLSGNNIEHLPSEMTSLGQLTSIDLSGNKRLDVDRTITHLGLHASIENLTLSNCNMVYLPSSVGMLTKVSTLDLSGNQLVHLPNELTQLRALESMNLSDNVLHSLGWYASRWLNLKKLNLSGNPELDYGKAFEALGMIELETLTLGELPRVPKSIKKLNIKTLNLENVSSNKLQPSIAEIASLQEVRLSNCKNLTTNQVLDVLREVEQLQLLSLDNNGLTNIDELSKLKGLQYLSLQEKSIDDQQLKKLERKLSDCLIDYDPANLLSAHQTKIDPPFQALNVDNKSYQVDASTAMQLQYDRSTIDIPSHAFLDNNGQVVTGNVDFTYREFNNPVEIMLSGIPMTYDSAGTSYQFASAGMVELRAEQNGFELFPNPEAPIIVNMSSNQKANDFGMYSYDEELSNWVYEGPDSLVQEPVLANSSEGAETFFNPAGMALPPRLYMQKVGFRTKKHRKSRSFALNLKNYPVNYYRGCSVNFPEFRKLKQKQWIYDGENLETDRMYLDSVSKYIRKIYSRGRSSRNGRVMYNRSTPELITDMSLSVNSNADNYLMSFTLRDTVIEIPVYPYVRSKRAEQEQRQNARMQKNYASDTKRRNKIWKKKISKYEDDIKDYEAIMKLVELGNRKDLDSIQATELLSSMQGIRTFTANNFGAINCDRLIQEGINLNPKRLAVTLTNQQNQPIDSDKIYLMEYGMNTTFSFDQLSQVRFYVGSANSLVVSLGEDKIAYLNTTEFELAKLGKSGTNFQMHTLDLNDMSVQELHNLLGS
jgi:Leucine-rich repeat (LRR) protein